MITLHLDNDIEKVLSGLSPDSKNVKKAIKRALRKTLRGVQRMMLREMSKESGVAQKNIKRYHRIKITFQGTTGEVWAGLNPLPLHLSGRVSWSPNAAGARVNGQVYTGSFFRDVYGGGKKVWIRSARNRSEGHTTYRSKTGLRVLSGASGGRFPVQLLGVPLDNADTKIERQVDKWAGPFFREKLLQELNFAILHERA